MCTPGACLALEDRGINHSLRISLCSILESNSSLSPRVPMITEKAKALGRFYAERKTSSLAFFISVLTESRKWSVTLHTFFSTCRGEALAHLEGVKGYVKSCRDFQQKLYKLYRSLPSLIVHTPQMHGYWPGITRMQNRPSWVALTRRITNISLLQLLRASPCMKFCNRKSFFCFKALYLKFLMKK